MMAKNLPVSVKKTAWLTGMSSAFSRIEKEISGSARATD